MSKIHKTHFTMPEMPWKKEPEYRWVDSPPPDGAQEKQYFCHYPECDNTAIGMIKRDEGDFPLCEEHINKVQ